MTPDSSNVSCPPRTSNSRCRTAGCTNRVRKLSDCRLYGIVDLAYVESSRLLQVARAMIAGGVDLIQLRGKQASVDDLAALAAKLHPVTAASSVPLVVNDHPGIASQVGVEGVHVGQDDQSIASVRETVNRQIWVGKSTHSLEQAVAAESEGADYIGFGPIYSTPTKPDYVPIGVSEIAAVHQLVSVPIFCIGGIKLDNLPQVLSAGAGLVVIVSGLLQAADITAYAGGCRNLLINTAHSTL
jgi:thiamine-phosphate pyrophosphorylase